MQTKYEFDVFISYSSHDEAWVTETLLPRLEKAGLKVCIDFRDFTPGRAALLNMQVAVRKSRHTLLVLSPNWFVSEWTFYESILARTKDPAGLQLRTIPLLLQECKFPEDADFIAVLTHIDFTKPKHLDLAWRQLLTALDKPPEPEPPKEPQRADWFLAHPYPMPPNFTGRVIERAMLTRWLGEDAAHPLLVLRALGGFGKSALAWHWLLHDVAPTAWPRVVWWSFYEGDASFDHFLTETLHYLSGGKIKPDKLSVNEVRTLLEMLHEPGTLLVLDGFERVLRAFRGLDAAYQGDEVKSEVNDCDCISPLAENFLRAIATLPNLRSKVLLTTRLRPRAVEGHGALLQGCREVELLQMQAGDAVEFFRAQGIRGTHTEIETACEPYGYHPLSLRLLAGLIVADLQQPGDIAAARHLDVSGDLKARQHHVLEQAYNNLTLARQKLLSRIACFRGPMKYEALKTLAEIESNSKKHRRKGPEKKSSASPRVGDSASNLDADLRDLVARGLLHYDTKKARFDLHPIVRRYAYDRLAAPDRTTTHTSLRDYFAAVPSPDKVTCLEDLAPVIELYYHTIRAGQYNEAFRLFCDHLEEVTYYQFGAYQLRIDLLRALFPDGEDRPPRLKDENDQGWTLNALAGSYAASGQPRCALPLVELACTNQRQGGKKNLAIGLGNVATQQLIIGALRAAEANIRRRISLGRKIKNEFQEAAGHQALGWLLAYRSSEYAESETELATALETAEKRKHVQMQGIIWAHRSLRELLRLRHAKVLQSPIANQQSAVPLARRALELADETARKHHPVERDYVRAHWLLGAAHRVAGQPDEAERHLHEALERCRCINMVDYEANILIDLARLRAATGPPGEAQRLAEEALVITERSGYVLQGADAHLELAKLALACNDKPAARHHATEARTLATCDGPPDYTYKAAYDEAGALLAELESHC